MWVAVGLKAHRLIQRLLERERTQAEFVGSVSHELRTPLNIIGGYVEMLLDQSVCVMPAEALAPLRAIAATNRGLGELIDKFLQYARADAGGLVVASLHDATLAARFADRVLLLHGDGRWHYGEVATTLDAAHLSALYHVPVEELASRHGRVFVSC